MSNSKEQSNPFSTGGGGVNLETRIQATYLVSMLTKTPIPFFKNAEIFKIKLQGKYAGYDTDDFIVFLRDIDSGEEYKFLGQIKNSISITEGNSTFEEVILASWNDFNNSKIFNKGKDKVALITGPLSAVDIKNTRTILEWARTSLDEKEFIEKINKDKFSSTDKKLKFDAFKKQITKANNNIEPTENEIWEFMRSFIYIGYE